MRANRSAIVRAALTSAVVVAFAGNAVAQTRYDRLIELDNDAATKEYATRKLRDDATTSGKRGFLSSIGGVASLGFAASAGMSTAGAVLFGATGVGLVAAGAYFLGRGVVKTVQYFRARSVARKARHEWSVLYDLDSIVRAQAYVRAQINGWDTSWYFNGARIPWEQPAPSSSPSTPQGAGTGR